MSLDRHLIDTIKEYFVRKSTAELQEMVQTNDHERWSAEAFEAAREVLLDRAAGRAQEPLVVEEEEPPPPSSGHDLKSLAFIAGLNLLTLPLGIIVIPTNLSHQEDSLARDQPVPFGSRIAWLALETVDTAAVATALGLQGTREATWAEGIDAAYQSSIFVTPPLGEWTLAVGTMLFSRDRPDALVKPLLERLSRQFGDAQYFCTHRDVELHLWARARQGRLVRGYGWLGQKGLTLWDEGAPTREERDLGFQFSPGPMPHAEQGDDKTPKDRSAPDEGCVMQLACLWSIDPTSLNEQFKELVMGLLGSIAAGETRPGQ